MSWSSYELLTGFGLVFLAVYYYFVANFNFWRDQKVKGPKPLPFFGNVIDIMLGRSSLGDYLAKVYEEFKDEPLIGIFTRRTPVIIVKDPELIKDVLIKDFTTFADRGFTINPRVDPLSQHLFSLEPQRWRPLRHKLSPTFTSGKLKEMFYLLVECADHFEEYLEKQVERDSVIECREITAKFTTDVIGSCAFGLKMNALGEEESQFRTVGRKVFQINGMKFIKMRIREAAPWLLDMLPALFYDHEINDFFIESMRQTMEYRRKNNVKRADFVDLLMEIRDNPSKVGDIELDDILITAQAFVFFIAGFETSSTTISNALYELALNPSVQDKLRNEIRETLKSCDGQLKYETIKSMSYMDKVFNETLRKYPPVTTIMRQSMEPYTFSGTKVTIPARTRVWIPAYAIQRDPAIYPDPDTFDPERFSEENKKLRHSSFFLPFGDGPRNCIGMRFANFQSKVGLVKILKNYRVEVCDKTPIPYVNNPKAFLLAPTGGIHLKFTKVAS
ncbi:cytochrome P450 6a2-like [Trichogramma pretiosum]|uniref:cytochrome P450 6a2-like n=1 Tax=Trichogramma pretiosum TaxID=7493 RepID=UPI0006C94E44|nr:cytochrome P450 6a2-like [Trichogramma pretiosum]